MGKTFTYHRDLVQGDSGDDVKHFQDELLSYSRALDKKTNQTTDYSALEDEESKSFFGPATLTAAARIKSTFEKDPTSLPLDPDSSNFFSVLMKLLFGMDSLDLKNKDNQIGVNEPLKEYKSANSDIELQARAAMVQPGKPTSSAHVNMALAHLGETNGMLFSNGRKEAWCADFANYVATQTYGKGVKLFTQSDTASALGYMDYATKEGVAKSKGTVPKVGDMVIFSREGGGHVGYVAEVGPDGKGKIVSGNSGGAVRLTKVDFAHPSDHLLGYLDMDALAQKKGIDINSDKSADIGNVNLDNIKKSYLPPSLQKQSDKSVAHIA